MKEINDEVKLTLSLMQDNINEGAYCELQSHLCSLLEMKRNGLQQRLAGRSRSESVTDDEAKPLTVEELKAGGWWCADISEDCANAFKSKGLRVFNSSKWGNDDGWNICALGDDGFVTRQTIAGSRKEIHRFNNDFYWS